MKNPRPALSAHYSDAGSGVNVASLEVRLDDAPVAVTATATDFSFTPAVNLAEGTHGVKATLSDNAGNSSTVTWNFFVDTVRSVIAVPLLL